jgi:hypothetical protein
MILPSEGEVSVRRYMVGGTFYRLVDIQDSPRYDILSWEQIGVGIFNVGGVAQFNLTPPQYWRLSSIEDPYAFQQLLNDMLEYVNAIWARPPRQPQYWRLVSIHDQNPILRIAIKLMTKAVHDWLFPKPMMVRDPMKPRPIKTTPQWSNPVWELYCNCAYGSCDDCPVYEKNICHFRLRLSSVS